MPSLPKGIAPFDDRILNALHDQVDGFATEALANRRIVVALSGPERPLETLGLVAFEDQAIDGEARAFVLRQTAVFEWFGALQANIGALFLLVAQGLFTLLLADQFIATRRGRRGAMAFKQNYKSDNYQRCPIAAFSFSTNALHRLHNVESK